MRVVILNGNSGCTRSEVKNPCDDNPRPSVLFRVQKIYAATANLGAMLRWMRRLSRPAPMAKAPAARKAMLYSP